MVSPGLRHHRRCEAGNPLNGLTEFTEPPLYHKNIYHGCTYFHITPTISVV